MKGPGQYISASVAGSCFVAALQLVTLDDLSLGLIVAMHIFSLVCPSLAVFSFCDPIDYDPQDWTDLSFPSKLYTVITISLILLGLLGLGLVFADSGVLAGVLFVLGVLGSVFLYLYFSLHREKNIKKTGDS
jgi:phosphatidylglycerophosphate synthase